MSSQVIAEADASKYDCPYKDRTCIGEKCMKWTWLWVQVPNNTVRGFIPAPCTVRSDKGSCGA